MFKSKIQNTQTNKHKFTQACHIKEIVTKHAILQCLSIRDQCMSILRSVWMCYTKCLNYDAGTHMYELCVYALTPCKRIEVKIYLWRFHLLKTTFALNVALHFLSFFSSKNILSNNYYKYRAFCNGIKPI